MTYVPGKIPNAISMHEQAMMMMIFGGSPKSLIAWTAGLHNKQVPINFSRLNVVFTIVMKELQVKYAYVLLRRKIIDS